MARGFHMSGAPADNRNYEVNAGYITNHVTSHTVVFGTYNIKTGEFTELGRSTQDWTVRINLYDIAFSTYNSGNNLYTATKKQCYAGLNFANMQLTSSGTQVTGTSGTYYFRDIADWE